MKFTCESHPQLVVWGQGRALARFRDGACETSDKIAIEALRRTDGVVADKPERTKSAKGDE